MEWIQIQNRKNISIGNGFQLKDIIYKCWNIRNRVDEHIKEKIKLVTEMSKTVTQYFWKPFSLVSSCHFVHTHQLYITIRIETRNGILTKDDFPRRLGGLFLCVQQWFQLCFI